MDIIIAINSIWPSVTSECIGLWALQLKHSPQKALHLEESFEGHSAQTLRLKGTQSLRIWLTFGSSLLSPESKHQGGATKANDMCQAIKGLLKSMAAQGCGSDLPWWSVIIWEGSMNLDIGPRRGATEHLANPRWFKPYRWSLVLAITLQMSSEPDHPGLAANKEITLCLLRHGSLNATRKQQPMK